MENTINGIHHITAIAGNAKRNHDFYTNVLGQRMVKKTVNFDDPETYHLYYGDKQGTPGTILNFLPVGKYYAGRRGARQATEIGYSVPENSFDFWLKRFRKTQRYLQQGSRKI
jgi:glyoxalase family protein